MCTITSALSWRLKELKEKKKKLYDVLLGVSCVLGFATEMHKDWHADTENLFH